MRGDAYGTALAPYEIRDAPYGRTLALHGMRGDAYGRALAPYGVLDPPYGGTLEP
jgi:hypothetical protein